MERFVSHLRGNMVMLQINDRQIYEQLRKDKEGIQNYQTHHCYLEAKSDSEYKVTLIRFNKSLNDKNVHRFIVSLPAGTSPRDQ